MERVSRALEGLEEPVTYNGLRAVVSGKERVVKEAVDVLVAEGFVVRDKGSNRSLLLRSARPFRESDEGSNEEEQGDHGRPQEQF
jgi:hypothetical protein